MNVIFIIVAWNVVKTMNRVLPFLVISLRNWTRLRSIVIWSSTILASRTPIRGKSINIISITVWSSWVHSWWRLVGAWAIVTWILCHNIVTVYSFWDILALLSCERTTVTKNNFISKRSRLTKWNATCWHSNFRTIFWLNWTNWRSCIFTNCFKSSHIPRTGD